MGTTLCAVMGMMVVLQGPQPFAYASPSVSYGAAGCPQPFGFSGGQCLGDTMDCGPCDEMTWACRMGLCRHCRYNRHRCRTTGDLYPHYPYYPENHGYYYMRPYNYTHVPEHQQATLFWGGDVRSPYSSRQYFDRIYEARNIPQPDYGAPVSRRRGAGQLPNIQHLLLPPQADDTAHRSPSSHFKPIARR